MMGAPFCDPQPRAALEISLRRRRRADRRRQDEPRQASGRPPERDPGPGAPGAESVPGALLPGHVPLRLADAAVHVLVEARQERILDRKSTRLNSSHQIISYAVFCLKK